MSRWRCIRDIASVILIKQHSDSASAFLQLFHTGKTKYPDDDNWVVTRIIEEIAGAELHRKPYWYQRFQEIYIDGCKT